MKPQVKKKLTEMVKQIIKEETDLKQGLEDYVEKLNKHAKSEFDRLGYNIEPDVFTIIPGKRFTKIGATNLGGKGQLSAFAFVDSNGDIYKAATFTTPAKGVRGNIFNPNPPMTARELYKR